LSCTTKCCLKTMNSACKRGEHGNLAERRGGAEEERGQGRSPQRSGESRSQRKGTGFSRPGGPRGKRGEGGETTHGSRTVFLAGKSLLPDKKKGGEVRPKKGELSGGVESCFGAKITTEKRKPSLSGLAGEGSRPRNGQRGGEKKPRRIWERSSCAKKLPHFLNLLLPEENGENCTETKKRIRAERT